MKKLKYLYGFCIFLLICFVLFLTILKSVDFQAISSYFRDDVSVVTTMFPSAKHIKTEKLTDREEYLYDNDYFTFKSGQAVINSSYKRTEMGTDYLKELFLYFQNDLISIAEKYNICLLNNADYSIPLSEYYFDGCVYHLDEASKKIEQSNFNELHTILLSDEDVSIILYDLPSCHSIDSNLFFTVYLNNITQIDTIYSFLSDVFILLEDFTPITKSDYLDLNLDVCFYSQDALESKASGLQENIIYSSLIPFYNSTLDNLETILYDESNALELHYIEDVLYNRITTASYVSHDVASTYPSLKIDSVNVNNTLVRLGSASSLKYNVKERGYYYPLYLSQDSDYLDGLVEQIYPNSFYSWVDDLTLRYEINGNIYEIKKERSKPTKLVDYVHYDILFFKNNVPLSLSIDTKNTLGAVLNIPLTDLCTLLELEIENIYPNSMDLKTIN